MYFCIYIYILFQMNETRQGTLCNRAIMLITDGAPDNYEEIYRQYNWPEKNVCIVIMVIYLFYHSRFYTVCLINFLHVINC